MSRIRINGKWIKDTRFKEVADCATELKACVVCGELASLAKSYIRNSDKINPLSYNNDGTLRKKTKKNKRFKNAWQSGKITDKYREFYHISPAKVTCN